MNNNNNKKFNFSEKFLKNLNFNNNWEGKKYFNFQNLKLLGFTDWQNTHTHINRKKMKQFWWKKNHQPTIFCCEEQKKNNFFRWEKKIIHSFGNNWKKKYYSRPKYTPYHHRTHTHRIESHKQTKNTHTCENNFAVKC